MRGRCSQVRRRLTSLSSTACMMLLANVDYPVHRSFWPRCSTIQLSQRQSLAQRKWNISGAPSQHFQSLSQKTRSVTSTNPSSRKTDWRGFTIAALAQALRPSPYSVMKNASPTTGNASPTHAASVHPPSAYAQRPRAEPTAPPMKKGRYRRARSDGPVTRPE